MSYQERSVYLNLAVMIAIFGGYIAYQISARSSIRLGGALLLLITLQILANIVHAATSRSRLVDERDRRISARGRQTGYVVLLVFIWSSFGYLLTHSVVSSLAVANVLILAVVVAELSGLVAQLISYKTPL